MAWWVHEHVLETDRQPPTDREIEIGSETQKQRQIRSRTHRLRQRQLEIQIQAGVEIEIETFVAPIRTCEIRRVLKSRIARVSNRMCYCKVAKKCRFQLCVKLPNRGFQFFDRTPSLELRIIVFI